MPQIVFEEPKLDFFLTHGSRILLGGGEKYSDPPRTRSRPSGSEFEPMSKNDPMSKNVSGCRKSSLRSTDDAGKEYLHVIDVFRRRPATRRRHLVSKFVLVLV